MYYMNYKKSLGIGLANFQLWTWSQQQFCRQVLRAVWNKLIMVNSVDSGLRCWGCWITMVTDIQTTRLHRFTNTKFKYEEGQRTTDTVCLVKDIEQPMRDNHLSHPAHGCWSTHAWQRPFPWNSKFLNSSCQSKTSGFVRKHWKQLELANTSDNYDAGLEIEMLNWSGPSTAFSGRSCPVIPAQRRALCLWCAATKPTTTCWQKGTAHRFAILCGILTNPLLRQVLFAHGTQWTAGAVLAQTSLNPSPTIRRFLPVTCRRRAAARQLRCPLATLGEDPRAPPKFAGQWDLQNWGSTGSLKASWNRKTAIFPPKLVERKHVWRSCHWSVQQRLLQFFRHIDGPLYCNMCKKEMSHTSNINFEGGSMHLYDIELPQLHLKIGKHLDV